MTEKPHQGIFYRPGGTSRAKRGCNPHGIKACGHRRENSATGHSVYANNNPARYTDPTGQYAGIDDLIFAGTGAAVGVLAQGVSDAVAGSISPWQDYAAAAIGGAAGGEAALYTLASGPGAVVAGGIAAGAVTNLAKQGLHKLTDTPNAAFNKASLAKDAALGGVLALVPGAKVLGVTSGRNSMAAIAKQIVTKLSRGQIGSVSGATAMKMAQASATDSSGSAAAAAVYSGIEERVNQLKGRQTTCPAQAACQ